MELLFALVIVSLLVTVGTFAYQAVLYLKDGYWTDVSATGFCARHLKVKWCSDPAQWIELHSLLEMFSPGGLLFVVSVVLLSVALTFFDSGSKP
jgi:hypothetical protein